MPLYYFDATWMMDISTDNIGALNKFSRGAVRPPLEDVPNNCRDIPLAISWLSILPKAGLFIVKGESGNQNFLRLVSECNLGEPIKSIWTKVEFGRRFYGLGALSGKSIHASCIGLLIRKLSTELMGGEAGLERGPLSGSQYAVPTRMMVTTRRPSSSTRYSAKRCSRKRVPGCWKIFSVVNRRAVRTAFVNERMTAAQ